MIFRYFVQWLIATFASVTMGYQKGYCQWSHHQVVKITKELLVAILTFWWRAAQIILVVIVLVGCDYTIYVAQLDHPEKKLEQYALS